MNLLIYVDDMSVIHFSQDGTDVLTMTEEPEEEYGRLKIALSGMLNHATVPGFCDELAALISVKEKVTLDMANLSYIDPSGIDALVKIEQQIEESDPDGYLLLTAVPEKISDSLQKVGAADLLMIQ